MNRFICLLLLSVLLVELAVGAELQRPKFFKNKLSGDSSVVKHDDGSMTVHTSASDIFVTPQDKGLGIGNAGRVSFSFRGKTFPTTYNLDANKDIVQVKCKADSLKLTVKGGEVTGVGKKWKSWIAVGKNQSNGTVLYGGAAWGCTDENKLPATFYRKVIWQRWVEPTVLYVGTQAASLSDVYQDYEFDVKTDATARAPASNGTTAPSTPNAVASMIEMLNAKITKAKSSPALLEMEGAHGMSSAAIIQQKAYIQGLVEMRDNLEVEQELDLSGFLDADEKSNPHSANFIELAAESESEAEAESAADMEMENEVADQVVRSHRSSSAAYLRSAGWMAQCTTLDKANKKKALSQAITLISPSGSTLNPKTLLKKGGVRVQWAPNAFKKSEKVKVELLGGALVRASLGSVEASNGEGQSKKGVTIELSKKFTLDPKSKYQFKFSVFNATTNAWTELPASTVFSVDAAVLANKDDVKIVSPVASQTYPGRTRLMVVWNRKSQISAKKCVLHSADNKVVKADIVVTGKHCEVKLPKVTELKQFYVVMHYKQRDTKKPGQVQSPNFSIKPCVSGQFNEDGRPLTISSGKGRPHAQRSMLQVSHEVDQNEAVDFDALADWLQSADELPIEFVETDASADVTVSCTGCSVKPELQSSFQGSMSGFNARLSGALVVNLGLTIRVTGSAGRDTNGAVQTKLPVFRIPLGPSGVTIGGSLALTFSSSFSITAAGTLTASTQLRIPFDFGLSGTIKTQVSAVFSGKSPVSVSIKNTGSGISRPVLAAPQIAAAGEVQASGRITIVPSIILDISALGGGNSLGADINVAASLTTSVDVAANAKATPNIAIDIKKPKNSQKGIGNTFTPAEGNNILNGKYLAVLGRNVCTQNHLMQLTSSFGLNSASLRVQAHAIKNLVNWSKNIPLSSFSFTKNLVAACVGPVKASIAPGPAPNGAQMYDTKSKDLYSKSFSRF